MNFDLFYHDFFMSLYNAYKCQHSSHNEKTVRLEKMIFFFILYLRFLRDAGELVEVNRVNWSSREFSCVKKELVPWEVDEEKAASFHK